MKRKYSKPIITKLDFTMASKYGGSLSKQKVRETIDGVSINKLVEEFGSPLFVFSQQQMEKKYKSLHEAFRSRYPKVKFSWSYKTNYLNQICTIFHNLGSSAEVVSEFEYQKARNIGVSGEDIIFNGPYKPKKDLKIAVQEGAKIHIDNLFELNDLEQIADELQIRIPVAIRLNMDTGIYPQWSKFGFNYENGDALNAVARIHKNNKLFLTGLHTHIGTFILNTNAYKLATKKLMQFKYEIEQKFESKVAYIDIGGGFASKSNLKGVYQSPDVVVPTANDYACAIVNTIYEQNRSQDLPELYLEIGRYLIDEAGYLLTSVCGWKRLPDGRKSYIVDAGVNNLYTSTWYNFNIETDKDYGEITEPSTLNGPLCMNIDVIEENIMLPPLDRDSVLSISPAGAYNYTQSMQFIRYKPAVVLIDNNGKTKLIKKIDNLETVNFREVP